MIIAHFSSDTFVNLLTYKTNYIPMNEEQENETEPHENTEEMER